MIAFVGLGNPGNKYADTKHNAGFWILDEMASRYKISFKPGKGEKKNVKLKMRKYDPITRKHIWWVEKKLPPHSKT